MASGILQKGDTFADGQTVNAARLNNLVDLGDVLAGLISTKTAGTPATTDYLLYLNAGGVLSKAQFSGLPTGVSSVGLTLPATEFTVTGSPVTGSGTLAGAWKTQPAGTVLAGPVSGSPAAPTFRALGPQDSVSTTVNIAASAIDWSLGSTFWKALSGNITFTFANMPTGSTHAQTIQVILTQNASSVVTWPTVFWPNHVHPVMTTGAGATDLYIFHHINGTVIGEALQNLG